VNQVVGGVLAKYQECFEIVIFAYTFLSNHVHILAQAPESNLWEFEQAVNREIAKRVNRLRNTRGHFWERRYDEQIAVEEADVLEGFLYVTCNAVSHGLVEHPLLWPGLNSYEQCLDGKDRVCLFTDYTSYGKACRRRKNKGKPIRLRDYQSEHVLHLTPLPQYAQLSAEERRELLTGLIKQRSARVKKERRAQGLGFLGREKVLAQRHTSVPRKVKRRPRPICYTKSFAAKKQFMAWFCPWLESFREASRRFRAGELLVDFPEHSIRPPIHYSLLSA